MGVAVNGVTQQLTCRRSGGSTGVESVDLSTELRLDLPLGDAVYIVSTYALRSDEEDVGYDCSSSLPGSEALQDYLGVKRESVHMTDRLWTALCATNYEAIEAVEFCIVGRTVEQILSVTSVPVRWPRGQQSEDPGLPQTALIGNIMTGQYVVDVQGAL